MTRRASMYSIQVIPAGYYEPALESLGNISLSKSFETYREDVPSFPFRVWTSEQLLVNEP